MTLYAIAKALGGEVARGQVNFPPPGHSQRDRSGSLRLDARAPDGFLVNTRSPADDPLFVKDWVRDQLGWTRETPARPTKAREEAPAEPDKLDPSMSERTERALAIWREGRDPRGTIVETYLRSRGLDLPADAAGTALRFHPACPFAGGHRPAAMIALVRDVVTNAPKAIHRTALDSAGRKIVVAGHDRLSLGPISGGAIKLTPDENVTLCLGVGEGIESALSLRRLPEFGASPVWSLISANGIERLPVLTGIEALWVAVDHDAAGLGGSHECAVRWRERAETFLVQPVAQRDDLNDVFKGRLHG